MPDIVLVILAVIFVLGVAINIHEFGHFIVAKMFGMRVEAYSFFGLGPRIWGFKIGHTDYRISAIPLGAYVKLYGDEETAPLEGKADTAEKVPDSELYELRPRWQKFLVMVGGPFMNIVLALAIPFFGVWFYGAPAMPAPIVGLVSPGGAAEVAGFKPGDRIIGFDGIENPTWDRIEKDALISPEKTIPVAVIRDGKKVEFTVTPKKEVRNGSSLGILGLAPELGAEPVVANMIESGSAAEAAGLQKGDKILTANGGAVKNSQDLINKIRAAKETPLNLVVERSGANVDVVVTPKMQGDVPRIGVGFNMGSMERDPATIGQAAAFAVNANLDILRLTGRVFGQIFSGERGVQDAGLAGPVGIVQLISQVVLGAGLAGLFSILAVISLNLGVFNLLPIPMLDGGQIVVLGIEKVMSWFGKTLSMAVREKIQMVGLVAILGLMAFTLFLDISRLF